MQPTYGLRQFGGYKPPVNYCEYCEYVSLKPNCRSGGRERIRKPSRVQIKYVVRSANRMFQFSWRFTRVADIEHTVAILGSCPRLSILVSIWVVLIGFLKHEACCENIPMPVIKYVSTDPAGISCPMEYLPQRI